MIASRLRNRQAAQETDSGKLQERSQGVNHNQIQKTTAREFSRRFLIVSQAGHGIKASVYFLLVINACIYSNKIQTN